jgi:hypothetical protein
MQVARIGFPSGPQLAEQQHRRCAGCGVLNLLTQRLRDLALADRYGKRRPLGAGGKPLAAPGIEGPLDRAQQLGQRQRLLDEIESAQARSLDGGLDRTVAGHHDHRAVVAVGHRPFAQQGDAVGIRHPDIQQHEVGNLRHA